MYATHVSIKGLFIRPCKDGFDCPCFRIDRHDSGMFSIPVVVEYGDYPGCQKNRIMLAMPGTRLPPQQSR